MASRRLPLLRGTATSQTYKAVVSGRQPVPPNRDPLQHRARLLQQLDALLLEVKTRVTGRDPEAAREIVAIRPLDSKLELAASQFRDGTGDVRIVGVDPSTGVLLLDAPDAGLPKLRAKAAEFGELKTRTMPDGSTKDTLAHQRALAPVEEIVLATPADWEGLRLRLALGKGNFDFERSMWFEIACRGGYRNPPPETASSRAQLQRQLFQLGHPVAQDFVAPEDVTFFVRLSLQQLRTLVAKVDCVFGYDLVPNDILTWLLLTDPPKYELRSFDLTAPPLDAPAVVVLDSGIASEHPLLKQAVLYSSSILPGIDSAADTYGHGTKMAGAALYAGDLASAIARGSHQAPHWIQSVRILVRPREGTASEEKRAYWPKYTADAITEAERVDVVARRRAFVLAVTYPIDPLTRTTYSQAVDQLAFNDGEGRLLFVSAGNVAPSDLFEAASTYPDGLVLRKIQEPAHGINVVTVGAYTEKTRLPPDPAFAEAKCVAPSGGISPHSTTGKLDAPWAIKPEIVLEGGNVALGSGLADPSVESLVTLTCGHNILAGPLAQINATSEASARAAHMAAAIWKENPALRPATIRGLLVHSASWTPTMRTQFPMPDRLYACGYGVPNLEWARACTDDRATVIVEDEMPNVVALQRPKKKPPKLVTTPTVEDVETRWMKVFRMPMPEAQRTASADADVELRVTLSYLPEPSTYHATVAYGLKLKWDMQGPFESESEFIERINDLHRPKGPDGKRLKKQHKESFDWLVGIQRRSRGSVQSDRWTGKASLLAGSKLIAVVPVLGWWDRRTDTKNRVQPFSLIVSVFADGVYSEVEAALALPVIVEVS
jgi:hypothetical protein